MIANYLAHQAEVMAYLRQRAQQAKSIRQEFEAKQPPPTKAELLARRDARQRNE